MKKITIFYHCHPINDFRERFIRSYEKMENSGLLETCSKFIILLNGDDKKFFDGFPKVRIIQTGDMHPNESKSANFIKKYCESLIEEEAIFYFHSKGVTKVEPQKSNVETWIEYLEYFNIELWRKCVENLKNFNCVGVEERRKPFHNDEPHYSGNFWWANSNYIKALPDCEDAYPAMERWILKNCEIQDYTCLFNSNKDFYHEKIKTSEYRK